MNHLCTYFDRNYAPQGLALYRSLERSIDGPFTLWILCLDNDTHRIFGQLDLEHARLITVDDLIRHLPQLDRAYRDRPRIEFYYACTPALVRYATDNARPGDHVAYVDADMFFFSNPDAIWERHADASVLIVRHRSGHEQAEREHGRFNVCWVGFAQDREAAACLDWWQDATLESTRLGDGVWGDQKYLDEFEERFSGVIGAADPGIASAPWNAWSHIAETARGGLPTLDGDPVVAFHYARLVQLSKSLFIPVRRDYIPPDTLRHVYRPYFVALRAAYAELRKVDSSYRLTYAKRNLRGAVLSIPTGRVILVSDRHMVRLGLPIPSRFEEVRQRREHRRRLTPPVTSGRAARVP